MKQNKKIKQEQKASVNQNLTGKNKKKKKEECWTGLPMALCLLLNHAT